MLMNQSGSYYENFRRSQRGGSESKKGKLEEERLMTDRSAYISFLEIQLERVSAACLTSQSFSSRIEEVQSSVLNFDEKLNNVARGLKLLESTSKHDGKEYSDTIRGLEHKVEAFEQDIRTIETKFDQVSNSVNLFRSNMEQFHDKQKEKLDIVRRGIEERVLEFSSRLDLEEARGRSNEAKIQGLGELTRTETKSALTSMQQQMDIKFDEVRGQHELRTRALETRLNNITDHVKDELDAMSKTFAKRSASRSVVPEGGKSVVFASDVVEHALRAEMEDIRRDLMERGESNIKRCMDTLRSLEKKMSESSSASSSDHNLMARMDRFEQALQESRRENQELRSEVERLQQGEIQNVKQVLNKHSTKILTIQEERMEAAIKEAVNSQNKKLRSILQAVEKKLKEQTDIVTQSMVRIEDFMELYEATQNDLKDRLNQGKAHQERLRKLLEQSAMALELEEEQQQQQQDTGYSTLFGSSASSTKDDQGFHASMSPIQPVPRSEASKQQQVFSPFRQAYEELSEIVKEMSFDQPLPDVRTSSFSSHKSKKQQQQQQQQQEKKKKKKKRRSLSAGPPRGDRDSHLRDTASSISRRRSKTPPPNAGALSGDDLGSEVANRRRLSKEGGGKRGRNLASMTSSPSLRKTLSDNDIGPHDEPLFAATTSSKPLGDKPAWNPGTNLSSSTNSSTSQRKQKLKQLYQELSNM